MHVIGIGLVVLGLLLMSLTTITSIGHCLYHWAHDVSFAVAAWNAFLFGVKTFLSGVFTLIIGGIFIWSDR